MALGARIRQRRKEFRLTQLELAQLIGVNQSTIQSLEARDTKKSEHEAALAEVLGVTLNWLRTGSGPKYPPAAAVQEPAAPYSAGETLSHRQRTLIDKLLGLSERTLDHLEPLLDDLARLQALERFRRNQNGE